MDRGKNRTRSLAALPAVAAFCALLVSGAWGQSSQLSQPPAELVRAAIDNQVKDDTGHHLFMWMNRTQKPRGSETKRMVQTPEGILGRLVAINDKPLTEEQRSDEEKRINRLLDPEKMREKAKQQKEDETRTLKMLRTLPDAFLYQYAGTENTPQGHRILKLDFTPNPKFNPPDREAQVFQGMSGQVWIDSTANRLVKIDGTLFKEVNFGWGILGRLYKGGRFVVEQADVGNGHWDTVRMQLKFDGKIMMVKGLHIEEQTVEWAFHPVEKMNVEQALNALRQAGDQAIPPAGSEAVNAGAK